MFTTEKASNVSSNVRPANLVSALRCGAFALIACGFLATPASAQKVTIQLSNGSLPTTRLMVGDELFVGLGSGSPGATYDLRLLDPNGSLITGAYGTADAAGNVALGRIWARTGVVGCDCAAGADPEQFRFETYQQAEYWLNGKSLTVQALTLGGVEVGRLSLPVMAATREISYFSNAEGCPRQFFRIGEPIYVSFLHADRSRTHRRIFLSESKSWPIGESILDVRGSSQWSPLPSSSSPVLTLPLAGSVSRTGGFDGVIRQETEPDPVRFDSDEVIESGDTRNTSCPESGGIVITVDGCPNCGGTGYP